MYNQENKQKQQVVYKHINCRCLFLNVSIWNIFFTKQVRCMGTYHLNVYPVLFPTTPKSRFLIVRFCAFILKSVRFGFRCTCHRQLDAAVAALWAERRQAERQSGQGRPDSRTERAGAAGEKLQASGACSRNFISNTRPRSTTDANSTFSSYIETTFVRAREVCREVSAAHHHHHHQNSLPPCPEPTTKLCIRSAASSISRDWVSKPGRLSEWSRLCREDGGRARGMETGAGSPPATSTS